jgi:hypothetical protein
MRGRFVIHVKRVPGEPGRERNFDARHKTLEGAQREIEHSSPAPPGFEYYIVEEPLLTTDPFDSNKKNLRHFGRDRKDG